MAKYRITDNVSGKTLVINGDSPPSETEAEQLFNESGIRGEKKATGNPIIDLLLGTSINTAKDIGAAAGQRSVSGLDESQNQAFEMARKSEQMALNNPDPIAKRRLLAAAQNAYDTLGQNSRSLEAGYSGDVEKGYLGRGAQTGLQIASAAELAGQVPKLATAGVNAVKSGAEGVGQLVTNIKGAGSINPFKVAGYARNKAAEEAGEVTTNGLIKAGDEFVAKNPLAAQVWEQFKPTIGNHMTATDLLDRMSNIFGQAYTKGGDVRNTAEAALMNKLYQAGKTVLKTEAPEVAKNSELFRFLYNAPKATQKATWLALKAVGLGKLLGM